MILFLDSLHDGLLDLEFSSELVQGLFPFPGYHPAPEYPLLPFRESRRPPFQGFHEVPGGGGQFAEGDLGDFFPGWLRLSGEADFFDEFAQRAGAGLGHSPVGQVPQGGSGLVRTFFGVFCDQVNLDHDSAPHGAGDGMNRPSDVYILSRVPFLIRLLFLCCAGWKFPRRIANCLTLYLSDYIFNFTRKTNYNKL